jgi:hypothetical protein
VEGRVCRERHTCLVALIASHNASSCCLFLLFDPLLSLSTSNPHPQKYRGMGSLEAMAKGSEARYLSDTQNLKIAQVGLAGYSVDSTCCAVLLVSHTLQSSCAVLQPAS